MESHSASKALPLDYIIQHAQTLSKEDIRDDIVGDIYRTSASICKESVQYTNTDKLYRSEKLDHISNLGIPNYARYFIYYFILQLQALTYHLI